VITEEVTGHRLPKEQDKDSRRLRGKFARVTVEEIRVDEDEKDTSGISSGRYSFLGVLNPIL
jgi:hypothetical protein